MAVEERIDEDKIFDLVERDYWMIRPCYFYKQEYEVCSAIKSRFLQYFVDGEIDDCSSWMADHLNCDRWKSNADHLAANEKIRKKKRLDSFKNNDVWEHRTSPPSNWNEPLPEFIRKRHEGSFLSDKVDEFYGPWDHVRPSRCVIS